MTAKAALTYADFVALPDDGKRYEILDGELYVTPSPSPRHQIALANLFRVLDGYVQRRMIGKVLFAPLDVIFADTAIAEPDLLYLDNTRMSSISDRGIEGPPTLLVEALSPSSIRADRRIKFELYARYQVPFYWILDPDARVLEAYRLEGASYVLTIRASGATPCGPPPFDDLRLAVDGLWE